MRNERESLQADILRHGMIENLSAMIERNQKPPYEVAVQHIEGTIDPPIDVEASRQILQDKLSRGEIKTNDINVIMHSTALRGKQTAELLAEEAHLSADLRPTDLLHEVHPSMDGISREMYDAAPDWQAVRRMFTENLFNGKIVDESIVDVYRRAERFLKFMRRIRTQTRANPAFVTHGMFSRFIDMAMQHEGEQLGDNQILELARADFARIATRPGTLSGMRVENTSTGSKKIETV